MVLAAVRSGRSAKHAVPLRALLGFSRYRYSKNRRNSSPRLSNVLKFLCLTAVLNCAVGSKESPSPRDESLQLPKALVVGVNPVLGRESTAKGAQPLVEYLAHKLRMPVSLRVARGYEELEQLFAQGKIHTASYSPLAYVKARKRLPLLPIAIATSGSISGSGYHGYIVVAKDSPFNTIEALRGRRIAWVDRTSASGYLLPRSWLRWRGIDPERFFAEELFTGNHLDSARAVLENRVDGAAVASVVVDPSLHIEFPEASKLRIIAKTRKIPQDCFVVLDKLNPALVRRLQTSLFTLDQDPEVSSKLNELWGVSGYVPADIRRYDIIENMLSKEDAS